MAFPRPRGQSLREAFLWFVDGPQPTDEAVWKWTGTTQFGYGILNFRGRNLKAPRVSYELHYGPIPTGMCVRHKNDTPIDVNPLNLELGSLAENIDDRHDRGRDARGEIQHLAKLTAADVLEMRRLHAAGDVSYVALGRRFGVAKSTAIDAIRGKTWTHL
ncbi:HNH endonuclease [Gordonia amicalis]|uniref:HNH endonuclease n=1 Tax=Gordonia amicalis TaxID=89053 RepID=UPI0024B9FA63|nr:HNH endonuclease [Gordonia amicalis]MDJ0454423.1 HNH endonuclease [Gordonia amicalis]MDV7077688.1 HNH endonuclease [Gordonia amicalis]